MIEQSEFRMPATGEGWRYYNGGLHTVIGMAHDENGDPVVVYTKYGWGLAQLPPIHTMKLGSFLQMVDSGKDALGNSIFEQRFRFEREAGGDKDCPFIRRSAMAPQESA